MTQPVRTILVEHGGHGMRNLGDLALLEVALGRLRSLFPHATRLVPTHDARALARLDPAARAVAYRPIERRALYRLSGAGAARALACLARDEGGVARALMSSDLVVAAGGGYLADAFGAFAARVLGLLDVAQRLGKPTALLGQGLGPATEPRLRAALARVLPRARVIGLRDGEAGPRLATALGAAPERVVTTGDDALALAAAARPSDLGPGLGVNVRLADYANDAQARGFTAELGRVARTHGAPLVPIVVSTFPLGHDGPPLAVALDLPVPEPRRVAEVLAAVARCRAVVTGSYHGAVFALGQGIPVVGLSGSAYYRDKLVGLARAFPARCRCSTRATPASAWRSRARSARPGPTRRADAPTSSRAPTRWCEPAARRGRASAAESVVQGSRTRTRRPRTVAVACAPRMSPRGSRSKALMATS
ncbi:MAG: polysaccharide pyruvyl transferase family protein [Myxococcota bacterium]